jgi:hypothetical protein
MGKQIDDSNIEHNKQVSKTQELIKQEYKRSIIVLTINEILTDFIIN